MDIYLIKGNNFQESEKRKVKLVGFLFFPYEGIVLHF